MYFKELERPRGKFHVFRVIEICFLVEEGEIADRQSLCIDTVIPILTAELLCLFLSKAAETTSLCLLIFVIIVRGRLGQFVFWPYVIVWGGSWIGGRRL